MLIKQVCALILAAGMSSRMGTPKQLLPLNGQYILERVIHLALLTEVSRVYTVIGHEADHIQQTIHIADNRFHWLVNPHYQDGLSSSLKFGIQEISKHYSHVLIFLGDLPLISTDTVHTIYGEGIKRLAEEKESYVIQPSYSNRAGHPVFFGHINQEAFAGITGDQGAKSIISKMTRYIVNVNDPGILFDIDTRSAYEQAIKFK